MAYAWGSLLSAVRTGAPAYHESSAVRSGRTCRPIRMSPRASMRSWGRPGTALPTRRCWSPAAGNRCARWSTSAAGRDRCWRRSFAPGPTVRGTLVDLPSTVARSAEIFPAAGVADRVTTVGQSFFDPLPAGADLYLLKNVLADWPDREATAILRRCAEAAHPAGRVVVLGGVSPDEGRRSVAGAADDGAGGRESAEPGGVPRAGSRGRPGSAGHRAATVGPLRR